MYVFSIFSLTAYSGALFSLSTLALFASFDGEGTPFLAVFVVFPFVIFASVFVITTLLYYHLRYRNNVRAAEVPRVIQANIIVAHVLFVAAALYVSLSRLTANS